MTFKGNDAKMIAQALKAVNLKKRRFNGQNANTRPAKRQGKPDDKSRCGWCGYTNHTEEECYSKKNNRQPKNKEHPFYKKLNDKPSSKPGNAREAALNSDDDED